MRSWSLLSLAGRPVGLEVSRDLAAAAVVVEVAIDLLGAMAIIALVLIIASLNFFLLPPDSTLPSLSLSS